MQAQESAKKKNRKLRIVSRRPLVFRVTEGVRVLHAQDYAVEQIECDESIGEKAYEVRKVGPIDEPGSDELYHLWLTYCPYVGKVRWHCDCKGHAAHRTCKHSDALPIVLAQIS